MAVWGIHFMINGQGVVPPDDVDWTPIVVGEGLDGLERRAHYRTVKWTKRAVPGCDMDWFQFDNTELTSFTCPEPDNSRQSETYTTAICKSVKALQSHGNMQDIQAVFLVKVD